MKLLLLGGGGFLSSATERELVKTGHDVTVLNRTGRSACDGTRTAAGDRRQAACLAGLASEGFDAVVDFLCFNAEDARGVSEAFGGRTGRVVMISTGSVYWCTGEWTNPVDESQFRRPAVPERPARGLAPGSIEYAYGRGKREAEETLNEAAAEGRFEVVALRFPVVGGPEDPTGRYAGYVRRVADGSPIVVPEGGFNAFRHLFVADAARAVGLALTPHANGAYNVCSHEIVTPREMLALMARCLDCSDPMVVPLPGLLAARLGTDDLFAPFSSRASQILDPGRMVSELGFRPVPYAVWLEKTVRWVMQDTAGEAPRGGTARRNWRSRAEEHDLARRIQTHLDAA